MDACGGFMRCILYLINFVMSLAGIIVITFVALAMKELKSSEQGAAWVLLIVGCFLFFIAFLGCCGVYHESRCMTITYIILTFILLVIQIGTGVVIRRDAENKSARNAGTACITLGVIELVAVIFSASLAFTFDNRRRRNSF